jgi:hypothetical protein
MEAKQKHEVEFWEIYKKIVQRRIEKENGSNLKNKS